MLKSFVANLWVIANLIQNKFLEMKEFYASNTELTLSSLQQYVNIVFDINFVVDMVEHLIPLAFVFGPFVLLIMCLSKNLRPILLKEFKR